MIELKRDGDKILTREGNTIEFKESFGSIDKYAKTIAAFANNKGGHIVFGVKNNPRKLVGLLNSNFEELDEQKIAEFLNSYFSPEIQFKKYVNKEATKEIGVLEIEESKNKPIVCIKQHNQGNIAESDIYYRYNSRTEKIKYPQLIELLDTIRENEENKWQSIFKTIAKTGTKNIIVLQGSESQGDGLHITDDANAMPVRIDNDYLNHLYDYQDLITKLKERYTNFSQNSNFYEIKKQLETDLNLCHINYLDTRKKKGSTKKYYFPRILKEFDQHYTKK